MIALFSRLSAASGLRGRALVVSVALLAVALLAVTSSGAGAQQQVNVAVLGVQEIMRESAASKVVLGEIQKREGALKAEVEKRENALLAADQQLAQQRGALSAEEFAQRSEEHTSELQSLMRISYAVFCLKKKKNQTTKKEITTELRHRRSV